MSLLLFVYPLRLCLFGFLKYKSIIIRSVDLFIDQDGALQPLG